MENGYRIRKLNGSNLRGHKGLSSIQIPSLFSKNSRKLEKTKKSITQIDSRELVKAFQVSILLILVLSGLSCVAGLIVYGVIHLFEVAF